MSKYDAKFYVDRKIFKGKIFKRRMRERLKKRLRTVLEGKDPVLQSDQPIVAAVQKGKSLIYSSLR